MEGAVVVDASTEALLLSNIQTRSQVAISQDETTFSSMWSLGRFADSPRSILYSPEVMVNDSSRHRMVAPSALSSDGTYWAVTAAAVTIGRRTLSSPTVLIWKLLL